MVVATPIGNLGDLAPRAVAELGRADLICCEDTRRTGRLLAHAGVAGPRLRRVDAHTESGAAADVVARIAAGQRVALVTDAGTPGVSDPGSALARAVIEAGLPVTTVPGPVAAVAALVLSGFDTARFVVDGFLPRRGVDRSARLAELAAERRTTVLYEAPARTARTLADLRDACGAGRAVAVARELTKLHEEVWRGPLADVASRAVAEDLRGEVVVVLAGAVAAGAAGGDDDVRAALRAASDRGLAPGRAAAEVAAALGRPRREVYALALSDDADRPSERNRTDEDDSDGDGAPVGELRDGDAPAGDAPVDDASGGDASSDNRPDDEVPDDGAAAGDDPNGDGSGDDGSDGNVPNETAGDATEGDGTLGGGSW